jgi:hypothetical protein
MRRVFRTVSYGKPSSGIRIPTTPQGREYALATGRFREAEFLWPLSGDQFKERTDATRPTSHRMPACGWRLLQRLRTLTAQPRRAPLLHGLTFSGIATYPHYCGAGGNPE